MNDPVGFGFNDSARRAHGAGESHTRAVGSPLPVGSGPRTPLSATEDEVQGFRAAPPPGRALANPTGQQASGMDRAMSALRVALPFVQRLLPLLDGNIGTVVSNLLNQHPAPQQHQPLPPPVDLEPIENGLAEIRTQHRDLRTQMVEQNTSLKRVEDQLEMVREATDRNTLEQQELLEDLKTVGNKVNVFALFALLLLATSVLLNVILFLHIKRVLP
jgi:hypothetical protein